MSRQMLRAMARSKDKQARLQAQVIHEMSQPEMRLARLESAMAAVVQDVRTIIRVLNDKKILEAKTESGLWVPPVKP